MSWKGKFKNAEDLSNVYDTQWYLIDIIDIKLFYHKDIN